jgi:hypothetical protein
MLALFSRAAELKAQTRPLALPETMAVELATEAVELNRLAEQCDGLWRECQRLATDCDDKGRQLAQLQEAKAHLLQQLSGFGQESDTSNSRHQEDRSWAADLETAKAGLLCPPSSPGTGGDGTVEPDAAPLEAVRAELAWIENARSWRAIQGLKRVWPYPWIARLAYGREYNCFASDSDPRDRLRAIKQSRVYRLMRAVKRTPMYRAYARRKYGPNFVIPGT